MSRLKKGALMVLGVLVALALAFSAGRFSKPSEVITKTQVVTQVVEKVVEKRVEVAAKAKVVTVERVITKAGEVREKIVYREAEAKTTTTTTEADKSANTNSKTATVTKNDAPRLTVLVLVGVDLNPAWQPIPSAGPLALGVAVNYRIAGPFTVGAWGVHTGAFGVALGAQF